MEQVSVIIPCYKQAQFLGDAIESLRAQTHRHYEIIVINDGSPDHPEEVVKRYPEVRYLHQDNQGVSKARNSALQESTGTYVVFLDADDRLLPNHFQTGVNAFHAFPDIAAVHGAYTWCTSGRRLQVHNCEYELDQYGALLRHGMPIHATMWKRDIVMKVGGFREFKRGEDHDLQLRVAQNYPISCHHELIAEYRQNDKPLDWAACLESSIRMFRSHRLHQKAPQTPSV